MRLEKYRAIYRDRRVTANIFEMVDNELVDPTLALKELLSWLPEVAVREWAGSDSFWDGFEDKLFPAGVKLFNG